MRDWSVNSSFSRSGTGGGERTGKENALVAEFEALGGSCYCCGLPPWLPLGKYGYRARRRPWPVGVSCLPHPSPRGRRLTRVAISGATGCLPSSALQSVPGPTTRWLRGFGSSSRHDRRGNEQVASAEDERCFKGLVLEVEPPPLTRPSLLRDRLVRVHLRVEQRGWGERQQRVHHQLWLAATL